MIYRDINISILWWAAPPRPPPAYGTKGCARAYGASAFAIAFQFYGGLRPQAPAGLRNKHKYKYNYVGHVKRHSNLSEKLNC